MASMERLEELLAESARLLNEAAREIKDVDLDPKVNIRKIGEVIVEISVIRNQIYVRRPDLKPAYLQS